MHKFRFFVCGDEFFVDKSVCHSSVIGRLVIECVQVSAFRIDASEMSKVFLVFLSIFNVVACGSGLY